LATDPTLPPNQPHGTCQRNDLADTAGATARWSACWRPAVLGHEGACQDRTRPDDGGPCGVQPVRVPAERSFPRINAGEVLSTNLPQPPTTLGRAALNCRIGWSLAKVRDAAIPGVMMTGHISYLLQRWRVWLGARWRRRWRLTRRGRVVVASLGILLVLVMSSLLGSWARDPPPAKGLPAIASRPPQRSDRAGGGATRGFTLIASGDVLPHGPVLEQARAYGRRIGQPYDFRPMFADLRPILAPADLAVCHLEVPLSPTGQNISSWPAFNAPPQLAGALRWAGYDACSTASNHSMDQGPAGVAATLAVMDRAGLRHAGMARSAHEADQNTILQVRGLRVALLSYTYGLNRGRLPPDRPWLVKTIDPRRILTDARAARAAGAQFVVVLLHWGQEYQSTPTPFQREVARRLLAAPEVDLILCHHVHVVQPIQRIGAKWVAYGVGNLLSNQTPSCCAPGSQDGVLVKVTVTEHSGRLRVRQVRYVPTWVEHPSFRIRPVLPALANPRLGTATRRALQASRDRTTRAVGPTVRAAPTG
jgi:poly-gamma-glutamate capsule biosynthesis protein CapA/YwtB (metallophosphatase superfamily)